jgi:hypothetical protein
MQPEHRVREAEGDEQPEEHRAEGDRGEPARRLRRHARAHAHVPVVHERVRGPRHREARCQHEKARETSEEEGAGVAPSEVDHHAQDATYGRAPARRERPRLRAHAGERSSSRAAKRIRHPSTSPAEIAAVTSWVPGGTSISMRKRLPMALPSSFHVSDGALTTELHACYSPSRRTCTT